jgi:Domain of unknown function (DUF4279)
MPRVASSAASLRITGTTLQPDEITRLLGVAPSQSHVLGETYRFQTGTSERKQGMWSRDARDRKPEDLEAQINELFEGLLKDPGVWRQLSTKYDVELFVGVFMDESGEGLDLEPATLKFLGERGIRLGLCLYGP